MFKHYLTTAWRGFFRYKLITSINVLGLALGLACAFAAIGTHSYFDSADRNLPNSDRIVIVLQRYSDTVNNLNGPLMSQVSAAIPTTMRKEFPNLPVAFVNGIGAIPVDVDGRRVFVSTSVADDEYLEIVNYPRIQMQSGNPLRTPRTAVVSEEVVQRLFGDAQPIGRTLRLQGVLDVTVAAVLKSSALPSHTQAAFRVDGILISRDTARTMSTALTGKPYQEPPLAVQWSGITFGSSVYVLLPADGSLTRARLEARLQGLPKRNGAPEVVKIEIRVATLATAWLQELDVNLFKGSTSINIVGLILTLGVASLCVALANYINMSFAQVRAHLKETGLRRVIGASRSQLVLQVSVEIALHVLAATLLAAFTVAVAGGIFEAAMNIPMSGSVLRTEQFWTASGLAVFVTFALLASCRFAGLALVKPSHALRADGANTGNGVGAYALLGAQFVTTSVLVIVLFAVSAQNDHARRLAAESSTDVLVKLDYRYRLGGSSFDVWRAELLRNSAVKGVTTTTAAPWRGNLGIHPLKTLSDQVMNPNSVSVSYDFEKVLDYRILEGRSFSADRQDIEAAAGKEPRALIDETLAHALGFDDPTKAVGKSIRSGGFMEPMPPLRVVGVIADKPMRLQPMLDFVGTIYLADPHAGGDPVIRIDKTRLAEGLAAIDAVWKRLAPNEPITREFADEAFGRSYAIYSIIGKVLTAVALIALLIAMMGGFAFALFATNLREKEIGVRKTLGAKVVQVFVMLLRDFSKPILVANILGWPFAYFALKRYLSTFEQPITLSLWYFFAGLVLTLVIAWLAVGRQAYRAARMNPATVLRRE